METLPAETQDSSGANPSSTKSDDSSPRQESGCSSPPPNCAICLGTCRNKSFTDSCLHQFCFKCLLTWSKVKAECPLCKQNFRSIIHNVRSNHQYEEYMVVQRQTEETTERIVDSLATATRRFRYRTTLTMPRRETFALHQFLMRYPMMAEVYPPSVPRRRSPTNFSRSHIYRYDLWARPLPDFTGRFRDCTPEFYRYNDSQMHRLVPWLNRELQYLLNENVGHISYVMNRILDLLRQYHINSIEFREAMQRYFGERTEHFLHELYCFASTPYDMTGYDRNVQYTSDGTISTLVNEVISSSESEASDDSDIVMISSSEPPEPPPGPSRVPAPLHPQRHIPEQSTTQNNVIPIETISHSDSDDDSSEVMVVGYIKPPQDRTPEVVDLLGSDSDVIVQDTTPEEAQTSETGETRPPLILKLSLTKPNTQDSESDDGSYTPPHRSLKLWRRNNLRASGSTSSTESYSPSSSSSTRSDSSIAFSSSDSEKSIKRKRRRKTNSTEKHKRKSKRTSHSRQKNKKIKQQSSKETQGKRKSRSGKGVKSSRSVNDPSTSTAAEQQIQTILEGPSTSGQIKKNKLKRDRSKSRSRSNSETKRLKSVVNIVSSKISEESSSNSQFSPALNVGTRENQNGNEPKVPQNNIGHSTPKVESECNLTKSEIADNYSDSEDDLPLNLTIAKSLLSLSKM